MVLCSVDMHQEQSKHSYYKQMPSGSWLSGNRQKCNSLLRSLNRVGHYILSFLIHVRDNYDSFPSKEHYHSHNTGWSPNWTDLLLIGSSLLLCKWVYERFAVPNSCWDLLHCINPLLVVYVNDCINSLFLCWTNTLMQSIHYKAGKRSRHKTPLTYEYGRAYKRKPTGS